MSDSALDLSFSEINQEALRLPPGRDGFVFRGGPWPQFPIHRHRELEFNLVTRGTARYLLRDRQYRLRPGSLIWLFPEQDHILLDRTTDYAHWIVCFSPERVAAVTRAQASAPLREPDPPGWHCAELAEAALTELSGLLETLHGLGHDDSDRFNAGLGYALLTAWDLFRAAAASAAPGGAAHIHPAVAQTAARLRASIRDGAPGPGLTALAAECGLSADHLARVFQRDLGMSVTAFRNQERLRRFVELGSEGNLLERALAAGFGSYAQFHRVFRQQTGLSPRAHRNGR